MEEDRVEYWLYPTGSVLDGWSCLAEVWNLVEGFVDQYLWNRQPFNLKVLQEKDSWHLYGSVVYGESVDDEWMVVAILKYITSMMTTVCARVTDTDGEIILIEAADHVPRWAGEPALAEGRVFLYAGEVHLVPVCRTPGDLTPFPWGPLEPAPAARFIASHQHLTRATPTVQKAICDRLGGFPQDTATNRHTTTLIIPDMVAALLHNDKQAVSELVNALRDRDQLDARKTRTMSRVRPVNMTSYSVTFPRCLYALLSSINVRPHRTSGWSINEQEKASKLGFQLSLGLEIILSRHRPGDGDTSEAGLDRFMKKLDAVGYFQGELEGSAKHKDLTENALKFWRSSKEDSYHSRLDHIVDLLDKFSRNELVRPDQGWLRPGGVVEDESWLEVTPESLDRMLAARFGVAEGGEENIPGELDTFLKKISDMAGVGDKDSLDFDPNSLVNSMKKLLGEPEGELLSDGEESSEGEGEEDPVILDYMTRLDAEVGQVKGREELPDLDRPLDVDSSVLSNLLASYSAELGCSGPASSILTSIGINPGQKQGNS